MRTHHESWYNFARDQGLDLRPDDIILVTGFVKTSEWALTAFDKGSKGHEFSVHATVGEFASAKVTATSKDNVAWNPFKHTGPSRLPANVKTVPAANPAEFADMVAKASADAAELLASAEAVEDSGNETGVGDEAMGNGDSTNVPGAADAGDPMDDPNSNAPGPSGITNAADISVGEDALKARAAPPRSMGVGDDTSAAGTSTPAGATTKAKGDAVPPLPLSQCLFLRYYAVSYLPMRGPVVKELPAAVNDRPQPAEYADEMCCFPCSCLPMPDICKWRAPRRRKPKEKPALPADDNEKTARGNEAFPLPPGSPNSPPNPPLAEDSTSDAVERIRGGAQSATDVIGAAARLRGGSSLVDVADIGGTQSTVMRVEVAEVPNNNNRVGICDLSIVSEFRLS